MLRNVRTMEPRFNEPYVTVSFVEVGFGLQLECWQFNIRVVIFEIELKRKNRIMNG